METRSLTFRHDHAAVVFEPPFSFLHYKEIGPRAFGAAGIFISSGLEPMHCLKSFSVFSVNAAWRRCSRQNAGGFRHQCYAACARSPPPPVPAPDLGPINKAPTILTPSLYDYLLAHSRESPALRRVREATAHVRGYQMQIPPEQAAFLGLLVELMGCRRALEIGVFTGYSSLALALALPSDGTLVACESSAEVLEVAKGHWAEAGVVGKIRPLLGPALETLPALASEPSFSPFDFAFVDADKRNYEAYYELLLGKGMVRQGGLILLDNVLWKGKVAEPAVAGDRQTAAIRDLNAKMLADERVTFSLLPIGDGLALCRVR